MDMKTLFNLIPLSVTAGVLAGCIVGQNYKRLAVSTPTAYKDTAAGLGPWKESTPQDQIAKGSWWELFGDRTLNELEQQATTNNQELNAAVARGTQARPTARGAKAGFFPNLEGDPSASRTRASPNSAGAFA